MQAGLADITHTLKNYRPSQTVLEALMAPSRRGEGAGGTSAPGLTAANGPEGGFVAVMGQKRQAHESTIQVGNDRAQYQHKGRVRSALHCKHSSLHAHQLYSCSVC